METIKKQFIKIIFDGEDLSGNFNDNFAALKWLQKDYLKGDVKKLNGKKLILKTI